MKKLVAISVLFAGLAMAVSAQWSNEWKVGLSAVYITDMFYAAKANGTNKITTENASGTTSATTEYGDFQKGVVHFFPNTRLLPENVGGDSRLGLQLRNTGENYDIRVNIDWDEGTGNGPSGSWGAGFDNGNGVSVGQFLLNGFSETDWGIKGNAGIFSAGLGPWAVEAAFVNQFALWGSWNTWADGGLNRFGVMRADVGWLHSDHFRSGDKWGTPFAVGMALGDNYKFTLGYNLRASAGGWWWAPETGGPKDSKSSINAKFMFSGRPADAFEFDLFYSVLGQDGNTLARPLDDVGYTAPVAFWRNQIGAYVGIKAIENLGISVGYTVSFNAYEAGSFLSQAAYNAAIAAGTDPGLSGQAVTVNAPIYSGIDLRFAYSGIDKIGLKFLNNVSFANTGKGEKRTAADGTLIYKDKLNLSFTEAKGAGYLTEGKTENWFSWHGILQAKLGFIDGVDLEVAVGNLLQVIGETEKYDNVNAAGAVTSSIDNTKNTTDNQLHFSVGAKYGVGNVTLGIALWLGLDSTVLDDVKKTTTASGNVTKVTTAKTDNVVTFGVPVVFQVSF